MVAESILRIPLEDLKTIRIKCNKCGTISEGPCSSAHNRVVTNNQCGACGHRFAQPGVSGQLFEFVSQIEQLLQVNSFSIEFVIPDPDKPDPITHERSKN